MASPLLTLTRMLCMLMVLITSSLMHAKDSRWLPHNGNLPRPRNALLTSGFLSAIAFSYGYWTKQIARRAQQSSDDISVHAATENRELSEEEARSKASLDDTAQKNNAYSITAFVASGMFGLGACAIGAHTLLCFLNERKRASILPTPSFGGDFSDIGADDETSDFNKDTSGLYRLKNLYVDTTKPSARSSSASFASSASYDSSPTSAFGDSPTAHSITPPGTPLTSPRNSLASRPTDSQGNKLPLAPGHATPRRNLPPLLHP